MLFLIVSGTVYDAFSQAEFAVDFKKKLDSLRIAGNFPGLSAAVYYGTNNSFAAVSGYADIEKNILLQPGDCLMQGSVGKTYVSAMALQLVKKFQPISVTMRGITGYLMQRILQSAC